MTDPIADLLTRIRNASTAQLAEVLVPASKLKAEVVRILKEEGYVERFSVEAAPEGEPGERIRIVLSNIAIPFEDLGATSGTNVIEDVGTGKAVVYPFIIFAADAFGVTNNKDHTRNRTPHRNLAVTDLATRGKQVCDRYHTA
jgi:hypothetical protein